MCNDGMTGPAKKLMQNMGWLKKKRSLPLYLL